MHSFAIAVRPIFLAEHRPQSLACAGHCPESTTTARPREMGTISGSRPTRAHLTAADRPESVLRHHRTFDGARPNVDAPPSPPLACVGGEVTARDRQAITAAMVANQG
ncbi:hypothetical protein RQCS_61070 (plasmid) [Rhodococcus qingshengii]|nr:hypothetical protein RQCS_61070 [Rhodococcus qingshengii]